MSIEVTQVSKRYGKVQALDNVTLSINKGIFGLLGPNGAGKTTLMRILATLTPFDSGSVVVNGHDLQRFPGKVRQSLGYLPQDFGFYPDLTAYQTLDYIGTMKNVPPQRLQADIQALLELVNLSDVARRKVKGFSGGMRQRLGIAQALLGDPQVLIVDEPTAGLDPEERVRFRNLLSRLSSDRTVLLSTHIVGDIEAVSTNIAILNKGRLIFAGQSSGLLDQAQGYVWELTVPQSEWEKIERQTTIVSSRTHGSQITMRVLAHQQPTPDAQPETPTLEDIYLAVVHDFILPVSEEAAAK
ncbi:MAG: ABC transporter ATP-binding protein [Anaerolineae bacterium]|nr:ABC transporter ATP-binding protein [Anaerolineae bacterium]